MTATKDINNLKDNISKFEKLVHSKSYSEIIQYLLDCDSSQQVECIKLLDIKDIRALLKTFNTCSLLVNFDTQDLQTLQQLIKSDSSYSDQYKKLFNIIESLDKNNDQYKQTNFDIKDAALLKSILDRMNPSLSEKLMIPSICESAQDSLIVRLRERLGFISFKSNKRQKALREVANSVGHSDKKLQDSLDILFVAKPSEIIAPFYQKIIDYCKDYAIKNNDKDAIKQLISVAIIGKIGVLHNISKTLFYLSKDDDLDIENLSNIFNKCLQYLKKIGLNDKIYALKNFTEENLDELKSLGNDKYKLVQLVGWNEGKCKDLFNKVKKSKKKTFFQVAEVKFLRKLLLDNNQENLSNKLSLFSHFPSGKKEPWQNKEKITPECSVPISTGSGAWYLRQFLLQHTEGYPIVHRNDNATSFNVGLFTSPVYEKVLEKDKARSNSKEYASRTSINYLDSPAILTGEVPAKYLVKTNKFDEAGITTDTIKNIDNLQIEVIKKLQDKEGDQFDPPFFVADLINFFGEENLPTIIKSIGKVVKYREYFFMELIENTKSCEAQLKTVISCINELYENQLVGFFQKLIPKNSYKQVKISLECVSKFHQNLCENLINLIENGNIVLARDNKNELLSIISNIKDSQHEDNISTESLIDEDIAKDSTIATTQDFNLQIDLKMPCEALSAETDHLLSNPQIKWLKDSDLKKLFTNLSIPKNYITIKDMNSTNIGNELHFARRYNEDKKIEIYKVPFILNINNSHWVYAIFSVDTNNKKVSIYYRDSYVINQKECDEVKDIFNKAVEYTDGNFKAFPGYKVDYDIRSVGLQQDVWSCGYLAAKGVLTDIKDDLPANNDIERLCSCSGVNKLYDIVHEIINKEVPEDTSSSATYSSNEHIADQQKSVPTSVEPSSSSAVSSPSKNSTANSENMAGEKELVSHTSQSAPPAVNDDVDSITSLVMEEQESQGQQESQLGAQSESQHLNVLMNSSSDPLQERAPQSDSTQSQLLEALKLGNINNLKLLLKKESNISLSQEFINTIFTHYQLKQLVENFAGSVSDQSSRELVECQMKCLEYLLEHIYKKESTNLQEIINANSKSQGTESKSTDAESKKYALVEAARNLLCAVRQAKESLQTPDTIKGLKEAHKQAEALDQYNELIKVISMTKQLCRKNFDSNLMKNYFQLTQKIRNGEPHIGKIVAGAMLSFLGVLGIIAGVGLILTGVGIPLAIPLKLASVVAFSSGAAALSTGLVGSVGGGVLASYNGVRGVKYASQFFCNTYSQNRRLPDLSPPPIQP